MHDELVDLFGESGYMRQAMRSEVEAALKSFGGCLANHPGTSPKPTQPVNVGLEGPVVDHQESTQEKHEARGRRSKRSSRGSDDSAINKFNKLVSAAGAAKRQFARKLQDGGNYAPLTSCLEKRMHWLLSLEEPPRTGYLSRFVAGSVFEGTINVVVLLNCALMVYTADVQLRGPSKADTWVVVIDWLFQVFYSVEIILKLMVHRQWFFCNGSWRMNMFDLLVVMSGLVALVGGSASGNLARVLRLLKVGKSFRLLHSLTVFSHLRALIVCVQGSLVSLFWSLFMLLSIYVIFSILFLNVIASHINETGEVLEETVFHDLFDSFGKSLLTLYKTTTGGDDWSVAYDAVSSTGALGGASFLVFIAFVQFALLNIILGIFVDSAMEILQPDAFTVAQETFRKELEVSLQLRSLCQRVNDDGSGQLSQYDFETGLETNRQLPLLLKSLGFKRHNFTEFFNGLAEGDKRVDIEEFVLGCLVLKGDASNYDVAKMRSELAALDGRVATILQLLRRDL